MYVLSDWERRRELGNRIAPLGGCGTNCYMPGRRKSLRRIRQPLNSSFDPRPTLSVVVLFLPGAVQAGRDRGFRRSRVRVAGRAKSAAVIRYRQSTCLTEEDRRRAGVSEYAGGFRLPTSERF
jgi:hypothetical protein